MSDKYSSSIIANLVGVGSITLITLVSTPWLIRDMGDVAYGLYRIALVSVVGFTFLLDLGFSGAVKRMLGDAVNKGDNVRAKSVLGLAFICYSLIALIAFLGIISLVPWFPKFLRVPEYQEFPFRLLLTATGIYVSLLFLQSIWSGVYIVLGRFDLLQISLVGGRALHIFGTLILIRIFDRPLEMAALAAVVASLITYLSSTLVIRSIWPEMRFNFKGIKKSDLKEFSSLGIYGLLIATGPLIVYQAQDIIVARGLNISYVAAYAVAATLATQINTIISAFTAPLFTAASRVYARGDKEGLRALLIDGTQRGVWVWVSIAGPLLACSGDILALWIGEGFRSSADIFAILLVGTFGTSQYLASYHVLNAIGKLRGVAVYSISMVFMSLSLSIVLINYTKWGLYGIAFAVSLPLLLRGFGVTRLAIKEVSEVVTAGGIHILKFLALSTLLLLGSWTLTKLLASLIPHNTLPWLILVVGLGGSITMLTSAYFVAPIGDLQSMRTIHKKILWK